MPSPKDRDRQTDRERVLSSYPRPWFYRPEVYFGFFIFPPVWSVLTLRSPWHEAEGFRGIMVGGVAWFIMIAAVVLSVRWVQEGGVFNLFIFLPGLLLTLVTQVQWSAHKARHGPPPVASQDEQAAEAPPTPTADGDSAPSPPAASDPWPTMGAAMPPRRRRRRRRPRSIDGSPDSSSLH